jgi:hypothetical protein
MKTVVDLRFEFKQNTGKNWQESYYDIDGDVEFKASDNYVAWLEEKIVNRMRRKDLKKNPNNQS